jgi:hypothetical protein
MNAMFATCQFASTFQYENVCARQSIFVGGRSNLWMNRTRVAPVKDSKSARKSLALFELCKHRQRADYLGR